MRIHTIPLVLPRRTRTGARSYGTRGLRVSWMGRLRGSSKLERSKVNGEEWGSGTLITLPRYIKLGLPRDSSHGVGNRGVDLVGRCERDGKKTLATQHLRHIIRGARGNSSSLHPLRILRHQLRVPIVYRLPLNDPAFGPRTAVVNYELVSSRRQTGSVASGP